METLKSIQEDQENTNWADPLDDKIENFIEERGVRVKCL